VLLDRLRRPSSAGRLPPGPRGSSACGGPLLDSQRQDAAPTPLPPPSLIAGQPSNARSRSGRLYLVNSGCGGINHRTSREWLDDYMQTRTSVEMIRCARSTIARLRRNTTRRPAGSRWGVASRLRHGFARIAD
jgi:hypothetical protein